MDQHMRNKSMDPKTILLEKTMSYVSKYGVADLTLRQLAEAVGTSHRMLVYHFGSKEGLVTEVVREVERREREEILAHYPNAELPVDDQIRRLWRHFSDPSPALQGRLFFEGYGQAPVCRPEGAN